MKRKFALILSVLLLACSAASAQEYVSVAELYEQAQAMDGWWRETFSTPDGEMTVDVPIIVPDVDAMPVLTVEKTKISEELFNRIAQGRKVDDADVHRYEVELEGELTEFYLGVDNRQIEPKKRTGKYGYDAVETLYLHRGGYITSLGTKMGTGEMRAAPTTFHYPWQMDADMPCVRNSDITLNEALAQWNEEIELCFPGETFEIQPLLVMLRGSTLTDATGSGKEYKRNGYLVISEAEQLIGGVPLMGPIYQKNIWALEEEPKGLQKYMAGCDAAAGSFYGNFTDTENFRCQMEFAKTRTVECEDVPLASLDAVLDSLRAEIENGHIREIDYIRLGYMLYSDPDMTDHAWAIPRWEVGAEYVTKSAEKSYNRWKGKPNDIDSGPFLRTCFASMPVDAQSGELIVFATGSEKIYAVPKIITWDDV